MVPVLTRLIIQLERKLGKKGIIVKELTDLLEISQDSVYRRLRGESEFTLTEIHKMVNHYDLDIDSVLNDNITSTNFRFNHLYGQDDAFEPYIANLTQLMMQLSNINGKLIFVASELPISQSFQNQGLREFKIYYWQKVILNRPSLKGVKFDNKFELGFNMNDYVNNLMESYANIRKMEIWTEETLDDTLRQIKYCRESGLMDNTKLEEVCRSTIEMLNRLEMELEMQAEGEDSNRLSFYVSSVELGNKVIMMDFGDFRRAFVKFNTFNTVSTQNEDFCYEIEQMVESVLTKSVEISGRSDIHRHRFFNVLRDKVLDLVSQYN
ncbi:MAG: hypothetical protein GC181_07650 [Bacteroidetes bacterium]|nr:hypothetical protein [Bacteroidota bacterium]